MLLGPYRGPGLNMKIDYHVTGNGTCPHLETGITRLVVVKDHKESIFNITPQSGM